MKYKKTLIILSIFLSLVLISQISGYSLFPRPVVNNTFFPNQAFDFEFNFTTSDGTVLLSNLSTLTTDASGVAFIDIDIFSTFSKVPSRFIHWRNDTGIQVNKTFDDKIFNKIYINDSLFNRINVTELFANGINISNVNSLFLRLDQSNFVNSSFIFWNGTANVLNSTLLNNTISQEGIRIGFNSTFNATYDNKYTRIQIDNNFSLFTLISNFQSFFDSNFSAKTTDDLTEGSTNLYDNQTWNETRGNDLYLPHTIDTWALNFTFYNTTSELDTRFIQNNTDGGYVGIFFNVSTTFIGSPTGIIQFLNNNFNGSGDFNTTGNITGDTGFFNGLGTLINRIKTMFIETITFNETINDVFWNTSLVDDVATYNLYLGGADGTESEATIYEFDGDLNVTENITALFYFGDGSQLTGISIFNQTYQDKADYQFTNNNFNGTGNFTTTGRIGIATESPISALQVLGEVNFVTDELIDDPLAIDVNSWLDSPSFGSDTLFFGSNVNETNPFPVVAGATYRIFVRSKHFGTTWNPVIGETIGASVTCTPSGCITTTLQYITATTTQNFYLVGPTNIALKDLNIKRVYNLTVGSIQSNDIDAQDIIAISLNLEESFVWGGSTLKDSWIGVNTLIPTHALNIYNGEVNITGSAGIGSDGADAPDTLIIIGGVGANDGGGASRHGGDGSDTTFITGIGGDGINAGDDGVGGEGGDFSIITGIGGSSSDSATNVGGDGGDIYLITGAGGTGVTSNGDYGNVISLKDGGKFLIGRSTPMSGINVSVLEVQGNMTVNGSIFTLSPTFSSGDYDRNTKKFLDKLPANENIIGIGGHLNTDYLFEDEYFEDVWTIYPYQKEVCEDEVCVMVKDMDRPVTMNNTKTDIPQITAKNRILIDEIKEFIINLFNRITGAEERITKIENDNELMKSSLCKLGETQWC